jgi:hypothetical protein
MGDVLQFPTGRPAGGDVVEFPILVRAGWLTKDGPVLLRLTDLEAENRALLDLVGSLVPEGCATAAHVDGSIVVTSGPVSAP